MPDTKRVQWLEQNVAARDITLTGDEPAALDPLAGQATHSPYLVLEPGVRDALSAWIASALRGRVPLTEDTVLYLARTTPLEAR